MELMKCFLFTSYYAFNFHHINIFVSNSAIKETIHHILYNKYARKII